MFSPLFAVSTSFGEDFCRKWFCLGKFGAFDVCLPEEPRGVSDRRKLFRLAGRMQSGHKGAMWSRIRPLSQVKSLFVRLTL